MTRIKLYFIPIIKPLKGSSLTIKLSAINFHTLINTSNDLSCLYSECLLDFNLL
jgi:hypothetical protein